MQKVLTKMQSGFGQVALLIDPEKTSTEERLSSLVEKSKFSKIDYFFVGGSTVKRSAIEFVVSYLKKNSEIPVVLFPGSGHQLSKDADALLFLQLISGRNPDFLIGHHVQAAEEISSMNLEVIPTSYILIDGGKMSSVAYVSQTNPIPRDQVNIAVQTTLAGKLLGHQLTYLDAGSGALISVPKEMISAIRQRTSGPIIIGGGIRSLSEMEDLRDAGANIIVIGNKIEDDIDFLLDISLFQKYHSKTD